MFQMYQVMGIINDERVPGLENLLIYMNGNFFCKDDPAINKHHFHITQKQCNERTYHTYNIEKQVLKY